MDKRAAITIGILVLLGIFLVFMYIKVFLNNPAGSSTSIQSGSTTYPSTTNVNTSTYASSGQNSSTAATEATTSVEAINGGYIVVNNFFEASSTQQDPNNQEYYYLAGGTMPAITKPPYQIFYVTSDQSFHITIYEEPIAQYRTEAEQALMQELGIDETQMCRLNYWVGTNNGLNPAYDSVNLGFSFCPGATSIPN